MSDISARLRERTTLRYMGDCKCHQCQLVPRVMVDEAADTIDALADALRSLIRDAALLHENAAGCAFNHYGDDFHLHGMPSYLRDAQRTIDAARAALARLEQTDG